MKVTIVTIVIGALGTITKGLLKGLEDLEVGGRVEIIQTTALLKNGQNPETSPGDLLSLKLQRKTISKHWCEKLQKKKKKKKKKKTQTLLIIEQYKTFRTNYFKAEIDNRQENSKCRLYGIKMKHTQITQLTALK